MFDVDKAAEECPVADDAMCDGGSDVVELDEVDGVGRVEFEGEGFARGIVNG